MPNKTFESNDYSEQSTVFNELISPIKEFVSDQNKQLPKHPGKNMIIIIFLFS